MKVPTPHIEAKKGEIAKKVLMPGDPLRAKYIAERYLNDAVCFNKVRNMFGYTGEYKGERVSVMGSGMGVPSMAIYANELYSGYDVDTIIRIGTAGGLRENVNISDIVIAQATSTDSSLLNMLEIGGNYTPIGDFELIKKADNIAKEKGILTHVGNIMTTDVFYTLESKHKKWADMGMLAVEMEAAGLYTTAMLNNKKALCMCTVSDLPLKGNGMSSEEREKSLDDMISLALDILV